MCVCYDDENGNLEFDFAAVRKARKPHKCIECRETIKAGQQYVYRSTKWEGDVSSWAVCLVCDDWSKALCAAQERECGCSGYELGAMLVALKEFHGEHLTESHLVAQQAPARQLVGSS
jgi:hypothetical protein